MRNLVLFILLAAAVSSAQQQGAAQASKTKILSRAEFDALLAKPGSVLLLDVRRPTEIAQNGGFPVYLNIQADDLEKHLAEIPKGKPIVTVSNHAHRAGIAADMLANIGFSGRRIDQARKFTNARRRQTGGKYAPEKPSTHGGKISFLQICVESTPHPIGRGIKPDDFRLCDL